VKPKLSKPPKSPMTMVQLCKFMEGQGVQFKREVVSSMRFSVPTKERKGLISGSFGVNIRDVGSESAWIDTRLQLSMPKRHVPEAIRLLRMLYDLRR